MYIYWYQNWPERGNPFNLQKKMHIDSFGFVGWCNSAFWPEGAVQTTIIHEANKSGISCACYRRLETAFVALIVRQYNKTVYSKCLFQSYSCGKCSIPVVCQTLFVQFHLRILFLFWNRLNAGPTVQPQLNP